MRRNYGKAREWQQKAVLGIFTNFSATVHGIVRVIYEDPPAKIQHSIIRALYKLNGLKKSYPISPSSRAGTYDGQVGFEVGVAEGIFFNFLDDKMAERLCEFTMLRKPYPILDFLVIVTYYYNPEDKKIHLNFDYYQLRFVFYDNGFEIRLFHNKGTRKMPLDELVNRILESINIEMKKQSLRPLKVEELSVL